MMGGAIFIDVFNDRMDRYPVQMSNTMDCRKKLNTIQYIYFDRYQAIPLFVLLLPKMVSKIKARLKL